MKKWPQKPWITRSIVLAVMLIYLSHLAAGCLAKPVFHYPVRVQAQDTGEYVEGATVTLEVSGKAPLDGKTDSKGLVRIGIPSSHAGQPGRLIAEATGYERYTQEIDLIEGTLPDTISLERVGAEGTLPTPTYTATPTITPGPASTSTSTPTSTSITADTPTQPCPAPTLLSPASGAIIMGEKLTTFSWQCDGTLQEREKFDLRIWRDEKTPRTIAMPDKPSHLLDTPPDEFGDYLWQVAVVRIDESGNKSTLCESPIWPFVWSESQPDAVVKAEALNLRTGPGVVYDVLGVLKRGDFLKIVCKCPAGKWLEIICPEGQKGWVACSAVKVNVDLASVPVATEIPPPPTPMHTPTPAVTPTPTPLPPPVLTEPENGAAFLGGVVILRWQWDRPRTPDEVFSVRVHREGETKLCHHAQARDLEWRGSLISYCTAGTHYWGVTLARRLCADEFDERCWQTLSEPSEERWFYYVPSEEPWTWPTPPGDEEEESGGFKKEPIDR